MSTVKTPPVKTLAQLGTLIAATHGWGAAKAFKTYALSDADREAVSKSALDLLRVFPAHVAAGAVMSAALAVQLDKATDAPVQVVAGTLAVEGVPVLGADGPLDDHVWVMIGATIIDISLFRMAYSAQGPARLARHIDLAFGPGKALFVDDWRHAGRLGLGYEPRHVLSAGEVTRLMGEAYQAIKTARG